jgi:hypothetical protein
VKPNPYPEAKSLQERYVMQLVDRIQTGDLSEAERAKIARLVA